MAIVTTNEMLRKAQKEGYAVGAFNVENMEMVQAVISAAEEMRAPVILQTTPSTLGYASENLFVNMIRAVGEKSRIPVAIHLDHGNSFALAVRAYRSGYTSIMIDGSKLPFEDNIALTKSVVAVCQSTGVPVEAELGCVGGKEDSTESKENIYTDVAQAKEFVERTGVDSLAVAIGTAHGVYKGIPKLDLNRLSDIRAVVDVPLVLHGTSGVPDETVAEAVKRGICKVNYATDLRIAYTQAVRACLTEDNELFDPKKYGTLGRNYVKECVKARIKNLGSENKA